MSSFLFSRLVFHKRNITEKMLSQPSQDEEKPKKRVRKIWRLDLVCRFTLLKQIHSAILSNLEREVNIASCFMTDCPHQRDCGWHAPRAMSNDLANDIRNFTPLRMYYTQFIDAVRAFPILSKFKSMFISPIKKNF